jgi:hypothetical protein
MESILLKLCTTLIRVLNLRLIILLITHTQLKPHELESVFHFLLIKTALLLIEFLHHYFFSESHIKPQKLSISFHVFALLSNLRYLNILAFEVDIELLRRVLIFWSISSVHHFIYSLYNLYIHEQPSEFPDGRIHQMNCLIEFSVGLWWSLSGDCSMIMFSLTYVMRMWFFVCFGYYLVGLNSDLVYIWALKLAAEGFVFLW